MCESVFRGYHCASDDEVEATLRLRFCHQSVQLCRDAHIGESVQTAKVIKWSHNCTDVRNVTKIVCFVLIQTRVAFGTSTTDGCCKKHQEIVPSYLTGRPKARWEYAIENDIRKVGILNGET